MPPTASDASWTSFGLLGCADIAGRRVLPAIAATPAAHITAVASRSRSRAESMAKRFGAEPVEGYQWLLERKDIDAVYISLPPGLHAEWIRLALRAGKHVLAEKPLTTSKHHTAELVQLARSRNLVVMENFMFLHHHQHTRVRELVTAGAIGELRAFTAAFTIPARPPGDIRYRPDLGGGALLDVGVYPIRAAQLFLGGELHVAGAVLRQDDMLGVDVGGSVLMSRQDGVTAQLTFGFGHSYVSSYQLWGSTARISVDHVFTPPASHRPVVLIDRQDHPERLVLQADDQCANTVAAFVRAIRAGTDAGTEATLIQAGLVTSTQRLAART